MDNDYKINKVTFERLAKLHGFKERTLPYAGENRLKCPIDHKPLLKLVIDNITIDYCRECCGIWLDSGELESLLDKRIECSEMVEKIALNEKQDRSSKECPACEKGLNKVDKEGIKVDICPSCRGVWLDGGEFALIYERHRNSSGAKFSSALKEHIIDIYV